MGIADCNLVRPLPLMEGLAREFYEWCSRGELRFQRCTGCGTFRHIPRDLCAECGSFDWEWVRSTGKGRVFTFTIVARALHPAFMQATPYAAVIVELEEGVRMLSNVVDCPPQNLHIGMPVSVDFERQSEALTVPVFRSRTRPPL
jgi:uncharacterized protein